ncbi:MAG: SEL1-like repeat protein [Hyphomicrobiales bacterium]|nr:SEL1-like repeat protein [Hyphomicrobiales bacterium]
MSRYTRSRQRIHDDRRDPELEHDAEYGEDLDAQALIAAAVAEARRHVRRNELRTNSALDAISDWIEKSEMRQADETKRLSSSQERVASAMRDALDLMSERLDHIEKLVAETPLKTFEPIRDALSRLNERVGAMEGERDPGDRNDDEDSSLQEFSSLMENLGQRVAGVVEKIDELADAADEPKKRGERIASIEAKLGSILRQLSRHTHARERNVEASATSPAQAQSATNDPASSPRREMPGPGKPAAPFEGSRGKPEPQAPGPPPATAGAPSKQDANDSVANLRAELSALAAQLQRLEKGQVDPRVLGELLSTTNEVRRLLADPAMPRLAAAIEQSVGALTRRIDALLPKIADREEITALGRALLEINAKLSKSPASEGVERRIDALSAKIDQVMREPLSLVSRHLAELSSRVPGADATGDAFAAQANTLEEIKARVDHLARSVERSVGKTPENLEPMLRQVIASVQSTRQAEAAPGAVQALERQVAGLAERLGDPQSANAINALGRSIAKLSNDLVETRMTAMRAAEAAATEAAAKATSALHQQRVPAERELHATLADMNATLERMMGSLSHLEEQAASESEERVSSAPKRAEISAWSESEGHEHDAPRDEPETTDDKGENEPEYGAFEAAALEAARNAAERAAQREGATPASVAKPAPSDEPLEPGSGRPSPTPQGPATPPIDELIRGPSNDPRPASDKTIATGNGTAMSAQALIAAARRAAAQSASGANSNTASTRGGAGGAQLNLGAGVKRKPVLLALVGLVVAFGAVGAGRLLTGNWPLSIDRVELPPSRPAPQNDRLSSLSPRAAAVLGKLKQAVASHRGKEDLSQPANDVTGSIVAGPKPAVQTPALQTPAPQTPAPTSKPVEPGAMSAAQTPDPRTGSDFLTRLKAAADADDPIAEYELASRLYDGNGMARDPQAAAKLFQRAANQGLVPAQYRLANIFETGDGLPQDLASARSWAEKAADRGNVKAMHNVGVYLAQGFQGKPDYATASAWFRKAAERNLRDSQFNLGVLLARGLGTPTKDYKSAYVWLALAARDGDAESAAKRDEVGRYLTNPELDEARAMIANFKPVEIDRAANEVDVKDAKWERAAPTTGEADTSKTKKL